MVTPGQLPGLVPLTRPLQKDRQPKREDIAISHVSGCPPGKQTRLPKHTACLHWTQDASRGVT